MSVLYGQGGILSFQQIRIFYTKITFLRIQTESPIMEKKGGGSIKIEDVGVLPGSFADITIPSEFARRALYYIPQYGHYHCTAEYAVDRPSFDWLLVVYVRAGTLYLETERFCYQASAGHFALVDCRHPHHYFCRSNAAHCSAVPCPQHGIAVGQKLGYGKGSAGKNNSFFKC